MLHSIKQSMKQYQWILFDADETLFHFEAFAGLSRMFKQYDVSFSEADYDNYQSVNGPLWVDYQNGIITSKKLQEIRFEHWADVAGVSPKEMNDAYMMSMANHSRAIDGARELLNSLKAKGVKLGIITNGFTALQQLRLEKTEFKDYFDVFVISEQLGIAKPDKRIFEHTFSLMGEGSTDRSKILMVGDNPHSDVLGGMNAGVDTCWLNVKRDPIPEGIEPTYNVESLFALKQILTA